MLSAATMLLVACAHGGKAPDGVSADTDVPVAAEVVDSNGNVSYRPDSMRVFHADPVNKEKAFIVISKKNLRLSVYADINGDTTLVVQYPVCLSRNKGQKERSGDMKTPESEPGKPFSIKQIQDASDWTHDFGDGRGEILSYGHWFMRLETPFSGIGIHGSTNNEGSVPGRASEGCIRLRDQDIITLKEKFAYVKMPVNIKDEDEGPWEWEPAVHKKAVPIKSNGKCAEGGATSAGPVD